MSLYKLGKGLAGGLANNTPPITIRTAYNAGTDNLPFGYAVAFGGDSLQGAVLPEDSEAKLVGVVHQNHQTANDYIAPGEDFAIIQNGDVFVVTEGAVSPEDSVFVYTDAGTIGAGKFGTAAEGTDSIELSSCSWVDKTEEGGLAKLSLTIY